jgi:hypothetical protein
LPRVSDADCPFDRFLEKLQVNQIPKGCKSRKLADSHPDALAEVRELIYRKSLGNDIRTLMGNSLMV